MHCVAVPLNALYDESMSRIRFIASCATGLIIWGSSLALMVYGLWIGAWFGFVFAGIFLSAILVFLIATKDFPRHLLRTKSRSLSRKSDEQVQG
jgi:hypothetical protein